MTISILLGLAFLGSFSTFVSRAPRTVQLVSLIWSTLVLVMGAVVAVPVFLHGPAVAGGGLWHVDGFGALLVLLISFIQWTATLSSRSYLAAELAAGIIDEIQVRRYAGLVPLFVFAMLVSAVSNNLGLLWIALEATTLATTLLVAFYARPGSLEAAWKYLILCSTGIALGLGGVMIAFYAASMNGTTEGFAAMNWTAFLAIAPTLSPMLLKLAFVLILIGYGTKAGFVPMHTWLPDAHSSAPSPISGLLSGVLLPVALFAILRFKMIVDATLGDSLWTGHLLIVFGLLSIAIPAAFTLVQGDYKRLLAYSSIEHMGIVALCFGIGGFATLAGVVHLAGHALAKSALFFGAGNIVGRFHSTKFDRVGDVARVLPYTASLFAAALLALLAVPPSPLFLSELVLVSQGVLEHPYAVLILLVSITVVAAGFIRLMIPLLYAPAEHEDHPVRAGEKLSLAHAAIGAHLVVLLGIGIAVWTAPGLALFTGIAASITS